MELWPFFEISAPQCKKSKFHIFGRHDLIFWCIMIIFEYVIAYAHTFHSIKSADSNKSVQVGSLVKIR